MPATATVVRDICAGLIAIHGQHDSQSLTNPAMHLSLLDQYAQNDILRSRYHDLYRQVVQVKREADALMASEADKQRRIELLTEEVQELDAANLTAGEEETLNERKKVIVHAQSILDGITAAHAALSGDEEGDTAGAADLLGSASTSLSESARLDESLVSLSERLNDLYYTARDLTTELADRLDSYSFDGNELDQIESRLDLIYRLKRKYGGEISDLLARRDAAAAELENYQSASQRIEELNQRKQQLFRQARQAAEALTQSRLKAFDSMNRQMLSALAFLNMPGIRLLCTISGGRWHPPDRIRWNF